MKFGTKAVHAGQSPDPSTGAIMTPIYQTSTYVQEEPGRSKGFEYSRTQNPTRKILESNLAALESGKFGLCFASGMAAIDAVLRLLNPGDEVIAADDLYGGVYRIFMKVFSRTGIKFRFLPLHKSELGEEDFSPDTKMLWIETPTNPMLKIIDIKKHVSIAARKGAITVVDNTFASPFLQTPLQFGADIVVHSLTKYISGHSDVVMGCVILNDKKLYDQIAFYQNACGAVPSPFDCFLVLRGVKTLHLRMRTHCLNAEKIALFLRNSKEVNKVYWPGFADSPGHLTAKRQMSDFGGMISFSLKDDDIQKTIRVLKSTRLFSLAESLGGVESLIGHPATMTHASVPREQRLAAGLEDSLIRLSVGIEDVEDLIKDLEQALCA